MPTYHITATRYGQTQYYFGHKFKGGKELSTTTYLHHAIVYKTMEKAQEWKAWLEEKFGEYEFRIQQNTTE